MTASRDGALGILIGAVIGTLFLVSACAAPNDAAPNDAQSASCADLHLAEATLSDVIRCAEQGDAFCADVDSEAPLEDLVRCAE